VIVLSPKYLSEKISQIALLMVAAVTTIVA